MRVRMPALFAAIFIVTQAVACGGTAEFAPAAPTVLAGCEHGISPSSQNAPASGGSFTVAVTTSSGCAWNAAAEVGWISVTAGSGSGAGSVAYTVASNPSTNVRQGRVRVGDHTVTVTQEGAPAPATQPPTNPTPPPPTAPPPTTPEPPTLPPPDDCSLSASPAAISQAPEEGTREIAVTTGERCGWQATTDAAWISLSSSQGVGSARVRVNIAAHTGSASRSATIRIGSVTIRVTQSAPSAGPCASFSLAPSEQSAGVDGGSFTATVTAAGDCSWSVESDSWISPSLAAGAGGASITYVVAPNAGAARQGTLRVGGRMLAVSQEGCRFALTPRAQSFGASGGQGSLDVATGKACSWSPSSSVRWIDTSSGGGRGNGRVAFAVAANDGAARDGRIEVGGQSATVSQAARPACAFSVTPARESVAASGGTFKFAVTTDAGCSWSAKPTVDWISMESAQGIGNGSGSYAVRPNGGAARSGAIQIAGEAIQVSQAATEVVAPPVCAVSLSPERHLISLGGGEGKFEVRTPSGCRWTAKASDPWIAVRPEAGSGPGTVGFRVDPSRTRRVGSIDVNGQKVQIVQDIVILPF